MCAICKKVDFILDSIKMLCPDEEWRAIVLETYKDSDPEVLDVVAEDKNGRNLQMNMAAMVCARWLHRAGIPFYPAIGCLSMMMRGEYSNNHDPESTDAPGIKKLDDFES